ncbi:hypothetical protein ES703_125265 [subsurface metagenome]
MDGTGIDKAADTGGAAGCSHITHAAHVYPLEHPLHARHNGYNTSQVKDDIRAGKSGFKTSKVSDISINNLSVEASQGTAVIIGQDEGTDRLTPCNQLTNENITNMTGCSRDNNHVAASLRRYFEYRAVGSFST